MKVALICNKPAPPTRKYGGTERVVAWLAAELASLGCQIYLIGPNSSQLPGVTRISASTAEESRARIPADTDIVHFHGWIPPDIDSRQHWLMTLHGNLKSDETPFRQTVFVSRNHAHRHNRHMYIYNGIAPSEYIFRSEKQSQILFFSKVRRRVKGADEAIRLARQFRFDLLIAGGMRFDLLKVGGFVSSFASNIGFAGELSGSEKAEIFANASALLFPIRWDEPFGLVLVESLISGTPVIARSRGSVPELVTNDVGFLYESEGEFAERLSRLHQLSPSVCRDYVHQFFTARIMATEYKNLYQRILDRDQIDW